MTPSSPQPSKPSALASIKNAAAPWLVPPTPPSNSMPAKPKSACRATPSKPSLASNSNPTEPSVGSSNLTSPASSATAASSPSIQPLAFSLQPSPRPASSTPAATSFPAPPQALAKPRFRKTWNRRLSSNSLIGSRHAIVSAVESPGLPAAPTNNSSPKTSSRPFQPLSTNTNATLYSAVRPKKEVYSSTSSLRSPFLTRTTPPKIARSEYP